MAPGAGARRLRSTSGRTSGRSASSCSRCSPAGRSSPARHGLRHARRGPQDRDRSPVAASGDAADDPAPPRPLPRARSAPAAARHRRGAPGARSAVRRPRKRRRSDRQAGSSGRPPLRPPRLGGRGTAGDRVRARSRSARFAPQPRPESPAFHDLVRLGRGDRRRGRQLGDLPRRPPSRLHRQRQRRTPGSLDPGARSGPRAIPRRHRGGDLSVLGARQPAGGVLRQGEAAPGVARRRPGRADLRRDRGARRELGECRNHRVCGQRHRSDRRSRGGRRCTRER